MSFSFSHIAASKDHAKALLKAEQNLTEPVISAFVSLVDAYKKDGPISMVGHGHLHTKDDYEVSTINLTIRPA